MARIRLNRSGVRQLLQSPEVLAELERRARAIADAAGDGHEVESGIGATRARASVRTESYEAIVAEAEDRNLSSALDAGRG